MSVTNNPNRSMLGQLPQEAKGTVKAAHTASTNIQQAKQAQAQSVAQSILKELPAASEQQVESRPRSYSNESNKSVDEQLDDEYAKLTDEASKSFQTNLAPERGLAPKIGREGVKPEVKFGASRPAAAEKSLEASSAPQADAVESRPRSDSASSSSSTDSADRVSKFQGAKAKATTAAGAAMKSLFSRSSKTSSTAAAQAKPAADPATVAAEKAAKFKAASDIVKTQAFDAPFRASLGKNKGPAYEALKKGFEKIGGKKGTEKTFRKNGQGDKIAVWTKTGEIKNDVKINGQTITKDELKRYNDSVKVTHDGRSVGGGDIGKLLPDMLKNGSTNENKMHAGARMVGLQTRVLANGDGSPLSDKIEFQLYNTNARDLRNLKGAGIPTDHQAFFTPTAAEASGKPGIPIFKSEQYKSDLKTQLNHFFERAKQDGVDVPVLGGFGVGAFLNGMVGDPADNKVLEQTVRAAFSEALVESMASHQKDFTGFIYADGLAKSFVEAELNKDGVDPGLKEKVATTGGTALDSVIAGSRNGLKMGLLNAGDPSCYNGQDFEDSAVAGVGQGFAQDEALHTFTTAHFSASGLNPKYAEKIGDRVGHYSEISVNQLAAASASMIRM